MRSLLQESPSIPIICKMFAAYNILSGKVGSPMLNPNLKGSSCRLLAIEKFAVLMELITAIRNTETHSSLWLDVY
jgi:hypothetical protein